MKNLLIALFLLTTLLVQGQEEAFTERVWRVNFINPGVELEMPVAEKSTFSTNVGVGYNGTYPELTYGGNGFVYIIAPFLDLQFKQLYNFKKRVAKGKQVSGNSGNFLSARIITHGPSMADNVFRKSDFDFAVGPT
ncbi:hypothetical protein [Aequorivita capsosiphonis]|uniref:hypothetical protein n=1 Tax=Aequorivita capsosiphonis TaxID=487317 RepID=UPI0004137265|nr:hypothetical protein [Aequorivita capsosiphonis]